MDGDTTRPAKDEEGDGDTEPNQNPPTTASPRRSHLRLRYGAYIMPLREPIPKKGSRLLVACVEYQWEGFKPEVEDGAGEADAEVDA